MSGISVHINPAVLKWAREEAGYSYKEIAEKVDTAADRYLTWEETGKTIPFSKLQQLSTLLRRQTAVFFLPHTPEKVKKPKDFRNLAPRKRALSKEVLLVIRRIHYFQQIARELKGQDYWTMQYGWERIAEAITADTPNAKIADWLRELLDISLDKQLSWKSDREAYKGWRQAVEEKLGILIFQFSMPLDEVQGFCMTEQRPYAIVVNSNHTPYARIFTIFHELGHILRHHSGLCLVDRDNQNNKEELSCNKLAGAFLAPAAELTPTEDLNEITAYANKLKVSREVYLRRLKDERMIKDLRFYVLLDAIKKTYENKADKKGKAIVSPEVKSHASRGDSFFNLVLEGLASNRITYTEAGSALGLRINRLVNEL